MSTFFSSQHTRSQYASNTPNKEFEVGLVQKVFVTYDDVINPIEDADTNYGEHKDKNEYITKSARHYGGIQYRLIGGKASETNEEKLPIAIPYNRNFLSLPVVGEFVKIYPQMAGVDDYYEKFSPETSPNFSTDIELVLSTGKTTKETAGKTGGTKSDQYGEANSVGIAESNQNLASNDTLKKGFAGKYFKRNLKTHQLELREGDTVLQGRFGNSIRFSGYLHDDKNSGTQYPAILIRNGESSDNQKKKVYDVVNEDINNDGTSIQITSGKYKTLFSPTINVTKEANNTYPSSDQLIGDQLVVNSGRVIISSKTSETFLFSKKTFSIFTDDVITMDSEKGLHFVSQNGNINITANKNKNLILGVSSGGKVFHGKDGADQQAILGNKMVDLLGQLIDAINAMTVATPSGPSAPGPIDKASFNNIKNQLKDTLSKNNYLI